MARLYGRARRLTDKNGGFRPGQIGYVLVGGVPARPKGQEGAELFVLPGWTSRGRVCH